MKARYIIAIAALAIFALASACYYFNYYAVGDGGDRVEFTSANGTVTTVYVEVADTPGALQRGLMYRTSLGEHDGMLFVFGRDATQSFWMQNTPLPLDMIFVNSQMAIVDINRNATPYSERVYTSKDICRYVVEVNGGFCDKHGIREGDHIKIYLKSSSP